MVYSYTLVVLDDQGETIVDHELTPDQAVQILADALKAAPVQPEERPEPPQQRRKGGRRRKIATQKKQNASALSVVWEGERFSNSPTGERGLKTVLGTLIALRLTYCEAKYLIDPQDHTLRRYALQHVKDDETLDGLKRMDEFASDRRKWRDFEQETIFTRNRIARLMDAPKVRAMLGQTNNTLDIPAIMDNGGVFLANLNGGLNVPSQTADLLGKVLTNAVLYHAKRRKTQRPVNLVIDEAHRYFSKVIPDLLAEVRKFGVSVVAGTQWLAQADDQILPALMNGPGITLAMMLHESEETYRCELSVRWLHIIR